MRIIPHEAFPERHFFCASWSVFFRPVTPLAARPVDQGNHAPVPDGHFFVLSFLFHVLLLYLMCALRNKKIVSITKAQLSSI